MSKCKECGWELPDHGTFCSIGVEDELGKQIEGLVTSDGTVVPMKQKTEKEDE